MPEPDHPAGGVDVFIRRKVLARLHGRPGIERRHNTVELGRAEMAVEHIEHGPLYQLVDNVSFTALFDRFQFKLAARRRYQPGQVAHTDRRHLLSQAQRPAHGRRAHRLQICDRHPDRHAGALVDFRAAPGERGYLADDLRHVGRHVHALLKGRVTGAFLLCDPQLVFHALGIVRSHLGAVPVLEGGDDAAPVCVVLRVGRCHDQDIERHPDAVTLDLDVPLFHQVEQPHLDPLGKVR